MSSGTKRKQLYLERDISWMYFNRRILQEAGKESVPPLERLAFLGIYSNNQDEFFRVRMASLNRTAGCDEKSLRKEAANAGKCVRRIVRLSERYAKEYEETVGEVFRVLAGEGICLIGEDTDSTTREYIRSSYGERLSGLIVPVRFSAVRRLDSETDESIYMAVHLVCRTADGRKRDDYAYFELPVRSCGRFIRLPDRDGKCRIMYLDDVVRCCLPDIFEGSGCSEYRAYSFKFTRDAEMEIENDQRSGILHKVSKGLKSRRRGEPLRVIYDEAMPAGLLRRVLARLDVDRNDTVLPGGRYHNHKDLMRFPDCGRLDLKFSPMPPILRCSLDGPESLLDRIAAQDRFLHVPYHSFDSFIRVLHEAAFSPNVSAVKITLYRLARESKVVRALIGAARNGKKVTVVIELLARFDEESNIGWAQKLQDAGVKVIFGVEGLKIHSKILHLKRKKGPDLACISSGNFHEGNASAYTDCILMTASRRIVREVDAVFDYIEKPYMQTHFKELLVSPNDMKRRFIGLINAEIRNRRLGKPAWIRIKINHITDPAMVDKLYEAAAAGVSIDLSVRGNCSLVTECLPASEHLRINGIIDRYLEHSRIFVFAAGGEEKVFFGSADWMPRNLDNRIEVIAPVYDPTVKQELIRIVDEALRDTVQGRLVDGSGSNAPWTCAEPLSGGSQASLYAHYTELEKQEEKIWKNRMETE